VDPIRAIDIQLKVGYQVKGFGFGIGYENYIPENFNQVKLYTEYFYQYRDWKDFLVGVGGDYGYDGEKLSGGIYLIERLYPQPLWKTHFGLTLSQKFIINRYYCFEHRIGILYIF
jgi:hypothetical protein